MNKSITKDFVFEIDLDNYIAKPFDFTDKTVKKEGFWNNINKPNNKTITSTPLGNVWLKKLKTIQDILERGKWLNQYLGIAHCRICDKSNGDSEYVLYLPDQLVYIWPTGYIHYIEKHNHMPNVEFIDMINKLDITYVKNMGIRPHLSYYDHIHRLQDGMATLRFSN